MNAQTQYEYRCEASYQRQFDDDDLVCNKVDELMSGGEYEPQQFRQRQSMPCTKTRSSWPHGNAPMKDGDLLVGWRKDHG